MKSIKLIGLVLFLTIQTLAQSTSFTYQGSLKTGGIDANGNHDFEFALFNAASGGSQLGSTVTQNGVAVTDGIFAVTLDFGDQFPGTGRFLEIRVRQAGGGAFTPLSPRQAITSTPYAVKSLSSNSAATATNATQLGGVAANQYVVTTDPRLSNARPPTAGSTNYIQNSTTLQAPSNFNISGTGTANVFNSTSDYNIFGFRVLSILGANNAFVGVGAGAVNSGTQNAFLGREAGEDNTTGSRNSFFGAFSGRNNTASSDLAFFGADSGAANSTGQFNSFVGSQSGRSNTTGGANSFFGAESGRSNVGGIRNSFFGYQSGVNNVSGADNTFMGVGAGLSNISGSNNSIFGKSAGQVTEVASHNSFFGASSGFINTGGSNSFFGSGSGIATTTGNNNSFFGTSAGASNTTGSSNTVIGDSANVGAGNLVFATAIGAQSVVGTSNTVVLGRPADTVQIPGTLSISGTLSANIFSAATQYNIGAGRILGNPGSNNLYAGFGAGTSSSNTGNNNAFFGQSTGLSNTTGERNSFFGATAGFLNTTGGGNSFFGEGSGDSNMTGGSNSFFGYNAGGANTEGAFNSFFGSSSGTANTTGSNNTLIGFDADVGAGNLTFATAIGADAVVTVSNRIQLGRDGSDTVRIGNLASTISTTQLCINTANVLAQCSSSRRYKENIHAFSGGLDLVRRLQPVTYDWIADKIADLGLIAEEVQMVEPLLVTHNRNGEIQGVKYDQMTVVLINAINEQQKQIEQQRHQIELLIKANQELSKRILDIERPPVRKL
ncbi:MAG: tail fiber domain-containing protein [Pyrinomonadaceae bacterium]